MRVLVLSALALILSANGAAAARWSLGANLGVSFLTLDETDQDYTMIGVPSQPFLTLAAQPGIRFGIAPEGSRAEVFLDAGFTNTSSDGSSFSTLQLTGNFQYSLSHAATHPYLTAGVGFLQVNSDGFLFFNESELAPTYGAGFGVRHRLHHGFGTLRAEVRYDRLEASGDELFSETNAIGVKLGFDVWGN